MRNTELANTWIGRMDACRKSGLRVSEYCRQNGLNTGGYYYWKVRLKKSTIGDKPQSEGSAGKWMCLEPERNTPQHCGSAHSDNLTVKISGAEIEIGVDFNPSLLRAVVKALGAEPC